MSSKTVGKRTVLFEDEKHLAGLNAKILFMVAILRNVPSLSLSRVLGLFAQRLVAIKRLSRSSRSRYCVTTHSVTDGLKKQLTTPHGMRHQDPGRGVLPHMGYTGKCRWIGYGFWPLCPEQGM